MTPTDLNEYRHQFEILELERLYRQPIPIVAACNRVRMRQEKQMSREWGKGVTAALSAVLVGLLLVVLFR